MPVKLKCRITYYAFKNKPLLLLLVRLCFSMFALLAGKKTTPTHGLSCLTSCIIFNFTMQLATLVLLLAGVAKGLIVSLPPNTPSFPITFTFAEAPIDRQNVVLTIWNGVNTTFAAQELTQKVFGAPQPELEAQIIKSIHARVAVYNSEDRNIDQIPSETSRPIFSVSVSSRQRSEGDTLPPLHFFTNDSPQFALRRFCHQHNLQTDDLIARDAMLSSLHERRLLHTQRACSSSAAGVDSNKCYVDHCRHHLPKFPGYEMQSPSKMKDTILMSFAHRHRATDCVETGTYRGTTTLMLADAACSRHVITIELSSKYAKEAEERFKREIEQGNDAAKKIMLIQGDSGDVLSTNPVFQTLERTLWFLDGHYSYLDTARGKDDSPLMRELEFILSRTTNARSDDIILVDDAREFRGTRFPTADADVENLVYPELASVMDKVCQLAPEAMLDLVDDVLIIRHLRTLYDLKI